MWSVVGILEGDDENEVSGTESEDAGDGVPGQRAGNSDRNHQSREGQTGNGERSGSPAGEEADAKRNGKGSAADNREIVSS